MSVKALEVPPFAAEMHLVSDYGDVTAALRSPDLRSARKEYSALFMGGSLAAIDGEEHAQRRRLEFPVFSGGALRRYEKGILRPLLDSYLEDCRANREADGSYETDLVDAGLYLLIRLAATVAGIDDVVSEEQARLLLSYVDAHALGGALEFSKLSPEAHERVLEECIAKRDEFERDWYRPSLLRRQQLVKDVAEGRAEAHDLPNDILTMLVQGWQPEWDDKLPLREVCVYLTASIRTSTRILTNVTFELSRWFEKHPEDRALLGDIAALRDAVGEALRLHPVLPVMIRRAFADVALPSGDVVREGEYAALLFAQSNRDPAIFGADADEFDPHRQGRLPAGSPVYGLAFGSGPHTCMGRRFAYGGSYSGDEGKDTLGSVNTLVQAFVHVGIEMIPDRPPRQNDDSFYDEFTTFPVRLTRL